MPIVTAYGTASYDPGGKTFWRVFRRHPCFVAQRRKVHEVSSVLHFLVQSVNKLWESDPQPFRIVLLDEQHSIVAKASTHQQIVADFEELRRVFGSSPPPAQPSGLLSNRGEYVKWKKQTMRNIVQYSKDPKAGKIRFAHDAKEASSSSRGKASMEEAWGEFLERAYHLGKYAIEIGLLPQEDLEEFSPYLYLGIPSLTLVQTLLRSQGIAGFVVGDSKCMEEAGVSKEMKPLFADLLKARDKLTKLKLSALELDLTHRAALFAGENDFELNVPNKERKAAINEVLALVNSVAIRVSQQSFYLKSFNNVLLRLGELETTPKKPELQRQASWLGAIKGVGSATATVKAEGDSQACNERKKGNGSDEKQA
mmetsp:Transcript_21936/g.30732  ORF Transcript_21936/g.30732 Transcript_21936/m.30732 type:complete len:368 (-) Transcript_21936:134-1237(-)